jgi:hypothetical protein
MRGGDTRTRVSIGSTRLKQGEKKTDRMILDFPVGAVPSFRNELTRRQIR